MTKKTILRILMGLTLVSFISGSLSAQLSRKQQNFVPIAAQTANGDLHQLKSSLNEGLDAGLSINEIKEALVHLYAYCGFPRSIRGLQTFMEVLDDRAARGINDEPGAEASPVMI